MEMDHAHRTVRKSKVISQTMLQMFLRIRELETRLGEKEMQITSLKEDQLVGNMY